MIRLRPYKACDAAAVTSWLRDEVSFRKWAADAYPYFPITAEDMNRRYNAYSYADNYYPMTAFDETGVVGHLLMRFLDEEKKQIRFGFIIVDDSRRGAGYGRGMLETAARYAFEILGAERVTLGVFDNNEPAYQCYRKVGFRESENGGIEVYRFFGEEWIRREMELLP